MTHSFRLRGRFLALGSFTVLALLATALATAQTQKHPRLVSARAARCSTCHSDLVEGKRVVHPATDDCTNCHEVEIGEAGTQIRLMDSEPTLCVNCHSEREGLDELPTPHPAALDGCTICHDPHATDLPRMFRARQAEVCAECHDLESLAEPHSNQIGLATTCTQCHDPHGTETPRLLVGSRQHPPFEDRTCDACHRPKFGERIRLQARGQRLCLACHEDPAEIEGRQSTHGALIDDSRGRAACLSCHNPHLSAQPRMLVAGGPDLCAQCHQPIVSAARAAAGHPAASDDCTNCHLPHAASETSLLNVERGELCEQCHDTSDEDLAAKHLGADLARLDCLSCHSPHGAGQPHLLNATAHPPVLEDCTLCHSTGAFNELEENGESALCLACHDDIAEIAEAAPVKHDALEAGPCITCHNPHAAKRPKLVREAADGCGQCHDDKIAGEGEVQHGVIDLIGCQACHEPHGGEREKLLRAEGAELCLACHGPQAKELPDRALRVFDRFDIQPADRARIATLLLSPDGTRDHPASGHRTLGAPTAQELAKVETTFSGELTCLVCHDPHKGKTSRILRWQAESPSQACIQCHPK